MVAPFFSNEYYGSGYIDNNLLILALNEHIGRNTKRKREHVNIKYFCIVVLVILVSQG